MMAKSPPSLATTSSNPLPAGHPPVKIGRIGVLIVNLGTPQSTDYWSMRRYLKEFLSDQRVIELNPLVWKLILNLFILPFRPQKSARAYRAIWNRERDESPLLTLSRAQGEGLAKALDDDRLVVAWAMRYGQPSIGEKLTQLQDQGCDRIVTLALYPQYSATTTASVHDQLFRELMKRRWQPAIRTIPPYYDHPAYIAALAASVRRHIAEQGWQPDMLLASFHGIPKAYFDKGDPYHCHCQKTGRLLREALDLDETNFQVTFQSRFGPKEWLEPYTDERLKALPAKGMKKVLVVAPGFASDCVETLEELAIEGRDIFMASGGEHFSCVPCLNDHPDHIEMLETLVRNEISGWL
nr:ferrochelatase [Iodidimonas gelatinilytica]